MKPQLLLTFLLALAIHAHARIFPSSELKKYFLEDDDQKTNLDMIIRNIYSRPARSPPPPPIPSPTKQQSILGSSTSNPNIDHIIRSPLQIDTIYSVIANSDTTSLDYNGPTKDELSRSNNPSPPPPPRGSIPTGQLIPVTLCMPGRSCDGGDYVI